MELSEETGEIVLTHLQRRSKSLSIPRNEQDDLVQDVAIWIGCHREPGRPVTTAWLWSALEKFAPGSSPAESARDRAGGPPGGL